MRNTLFILLMFVFPGSLVAQETLGKVVNTLKERINLSAYAQLGYTYNSAADPDNTFDIKRVIDVYKRQGYDLLWPYIAFTALSGRTCIDSYRTKIL